MPESATGETSVRSARELLGVAADADAAQVARAYRRQARRVHPDLSIEPDSAERFWMLRAAYQIALDAAPRKLQVAARNETAGTWSEVAWLAVGPVHVHPPLRSPGRTATRSGERR